MRPSVLAILLAVLATALAPALIAGSLEPPPGSPGPTMKTLVDVEPRVDVLTLAGAGPSLHRITAPGSYYLSGNIVTTDGMVAIEIASADVSLDLSGFRLRSVPGATPSIGIAVASQRENITIRNGFLSDWAVGIQASTSDRIHVSDITVVRTSGKAIGVGPYSIIERCIVATESLIGVEAINSLVRGNVIFSGGQAIYDSTGLTTAVDNHTP